ncbi:hypothetical protein [Cellulophaga omnivescoria]|uniref:hypothetical protein n=1 Tax=Cellulophaga omnivescoria TaxID=1888890 RepID=UPI000987CEB5|nr:hypothetical protein [Cellulophaga omnivescoria]
MKKTINFILAFSFLLFLSLTIWINYLMKNNVGDIAYDSSIDDSSFVVCNEEQIFQYYSVGTSYEGERKAIREEIFTELENKNLVFGNKSGYITFRFIVNCNGQAGRYRFKEVDSHFLETSSKEDLINQLKVAVMKLNKWKAGTLNNDTPVDSYYQINFKIIEGKIEDIF